MKTEGKMELEVPENEQGVGDKLQKKDNMELVEVPEHEQEDMRCGQLEVGQEQTADSIAAGEAVAAGECVEVVVAEEAGRIGFEDIQEHQMGDIQEHQMEEEEEELSFEHQSLDYILEQEEQIQLCWDYHNYHNQVQSMQEDIAKNQVGELVVVADDEVVAAESAAEDNTDTHSPRMGAAHYQLESATRTYRSKYHKTSSHS